MRLAYPKPRARHRRRQARRREIARLQAVRREVLRRDGACRLYWGDAATRRLLAEAFGPCGGPTELAHYNATHRRSKTVGQPAEARHDAAWALALCRAHHRAYDAHRFRIEALTDRGCHGPLRIVSRAVVWEEQP